MAVWPTVAAVGLVVLAGAAGAAVWWRQPAPVAVPWSGPVSLCLVVANQVERVEGLVGEMLGTAGALGPRCIDLVVADEGSTDGTWDVLERLQRRHPAIKTLRWPADTLGKGHVLDAACALCAGRCILLRLARGAAPEPAPGDPWRIRSAVEG